CARVGRRDPVAAPDTTPAVGGCLGATGPGLPSWRACARRWSAARPPIIGRRTAPGVARKSAMSTSMGTGRCLKVGGLVDLALTEAAGGHVNGWQRIPEAA